ncbi:dj-1 family protein [Phlyctema vagabunda]|uniref:Dj-1 family protein n=1 Tax=Phlyctema vagabunda TaxID=108571 RepID=A0ABR4PM09_9HELO
MGESIKKPLNIGFLVFPTFQALDVFGPLDALNVLAQKTQLNLYLISSSLDPVSTKPSPSRADLNQFGSDFGESVLPTHTFETAPSLDVLFIPGGAGTRDQTHMAVYSEYIRTVYPSLQYVVTICTGAALAAVSGILDGRRATTNKRAWAFVSELGKKTHWIAKARWVEDGNIWTGAGVSAGIDVTYAWIAKVWGDDLAHEISTTMEYTRVLEWDSDPFSSVWSIEDVLPQSS